MKQHYLSLLLAAVMTAIPALPVVAADESSTAAESYTSGEYTYTLTAEDTASITGYTGSEADVAVPSTLGGYSVTQIADDAFQQNTAMTSLTLPAGLEDIGSSSFFGCSSLSSIAVESGSDSFAVTENVLFSADGACLVLYPPALTETAYTIPDGVTEIWPGAFAQTNLTDVTFSDDLLYVDAWAFAYTPLSSLELPESLTAIYDYAFAYCTELTGVTFPSSLATIGAASFAGCASLSDITLPESLTTVEMAAFSGTALKEVTVPVGVSEIGFCAFGYEADMTTPVEDFVIYGTTGSAAQTYATEEDSDNDYTNSFTFQSISADGETGEQVSVQTEATEKSFWQKAVKWGLLVVLVLAALIGGVVLLFGGKPGSKQERRKQGTDRKKSKAPVPEELPDEPAGSDEIPSAGKDPQ